jgi:L-alanine-DL-glutamate epimerase-like enolase superfamily enzyme
VDQLASLGGPPDRWIVNVRVSKMGGLPRSLHVVGAACEAGSGIIVGAQVGETSLLTRAALPVAQAAGASLAAQEGAFGTRLLARDVCDPPLIFGPAGVLETDAFPALRRPGFGILQCQDTGRQA